jgi:hypothetical protein
MESKINRLLQNTPPNIVFLSSWLKKQGYSNDLQNRYVKSGWFVRIGQGAFIRKGDKVDIYGAIYSLQNQTPIKIHIGGRTALGLQNLSHYLELYQNEVLLFIHGKTNLPSWFVNKHWDITPVVKGTQFLDDALELKKHDISNLRLTISTPLRAFLECLYLSPEEFDLEEAAAIMDSLTFLHPETVQNTLQKCNSVKVVRLFLFLAERSGHTWFDKIIIDHLNMGSGKRKIVSNGVYVSKYQITVPHTLVTK